MVDDVACPICGQANPGDSNFCSVCGSSLTRAADADAPEGGEGRTESHPALGSDGPGEVPMVIVTRGANAGSRFALDGAVTTIGRHPDSVVFLDDVTVSRRHAEIRAVDGGFEVADAGSLNGTYVNNRRIERSPLTEGDQLQVGKYKLVFVVGVPGGDA